MILIVLGDKFRKYLGVTIDYFSNLAICEIKIDFKLLYVLKNYI